jgi:hypothetical protein
MCAEPVGESVPGGGGARNQALNILEKKKKNSRKPR